MKNISIKKIATILVVALLILSISSAVLATSALDPNAIRPQYSQGVSKVQSIAGYILAVAQAIAIAVAVIMLVVLAIKYFTSSAQDKADVKKSATAYVLGAVLLFGGVALLQMIQGFATQL